MTSSTSEGNIYEEMLTTAVQIQQQYYELLPDWTIYEKDHYEILKQNIGYALFGPPTTSFQTDDTRNDSNESFIVVSYKSNDMGQLTNINENVQYNEAAMEIISKIFNQIIDNGKEPNGSIYCGIVYNIIFQEKMQENNATNEKNEEKVKTMKHEKNDIHAVPVFKIRNYSKTGKASSSKDITDTYTVWYVDNNGRVYTNWKDYQKCNKLPPCMMVIPKDGFYQPNPEFEITQTFSTVWVEVMSSPASWLNSKFLTHADSLSNVLSVGALGIGVVSMVTPVAPVVVTAGLVSTGISGLWTAGRSAQYLVDRGLHRESISPADRSTLSAWLGIAGCTTALVTSGGGILLSRASRAGCSIGLTARVAYNATVIGNISINLVGIGYSGYCMFEKYQEGGNIELLDVLFFATHVMFFGNAVIDANFAHDIIATSRNNVMNDYEITLRSKRHRKAYNRAKRNGTTKTEVIRSVKRVKTKKELFSNTANKNTDNNIAKNSIISNISMKNGTLKYKDITLLNPLMFVQKLINSPMFNDFLLRSTGNSNYAELCIMVVTLLTNYYNGVEQFDNIATLTDFESILKELQYLDNAIDILEKIFYFVLEIINNSDKLYNYLDKVVHLVWKYAKMHLMEIGIDPHSESSLISEILSCIISQIYHNIAELVDKFIEALNKHLHL